MVGISAVFVLINDGRLNDSESNRFAWFKSILLDWSFAFLKETLSPARSDNDADDPKTPAKAEDVKLMKDEELYNNLTKTSSNLNQLVEDVKANPKRYVNFSVFGKNADKK